MLGFGKRKAETQQPKPQRETRRTLSTGMQRRSLMQAAATDRLTADWPSHPLPADDIIRRNQRIVVARSREQASNNDYAKRFLRMCRQNIVGSDGVQLQAQVRDPDGTMDDLANEAIESGWKEWGKAGNCDVTGQQSWRQILASAVTSAGKDGEYMIRMIRGRDAGPWLFSLQVLDPQRCPVDFDQVKFPNGDFIRHGIRFNRYGRPLAYLFSTTDEEISSYSYAGRYFEVVPADEMIHGFVIDMVGQKRGLPWMATSLWRMNMLNKFEQATLTAARWGASKQGFFEWEEGYGPDADDDEDVIIDAEMGVYHELPQGVRVKETASNFPTGESAPFTKQMLRGIASGMGVAYNNLANDLEGVNFSSIRQGVLDERENWKEMQQWLIETLCERVYGEWLQFALLQGRLQVNGKPLKANRIDKYRQVVWQARRWSWVDPKADVAANRESQAAMHKAPSDIIRESGKDPDTVWRQIGQDIKAMTNAGIPENFIVAAMNQKLAGGGNEPEPVRPDTED